ncbi:peptidoglycan D,D-transpeptidase FtsI family protein [Candidatus Stoquefichus massiliensis]|uniref:peptidoglycan D,D-transpeptidase FtsI family protein n=1 Tax=Candidatus Stoquefichus massiliensis TaxID=1470350 RepID=UPI00047FA0E4|nr:penicillin-binding protein 2 [Candidatus Stoquefichus massiliensis]
MGLFKKNQIRFNGQKEIESKMKNQTNNVISRRFKILMASVAIMGAILLIRLFMTQISQKDYYAAKLTQYNTSVFTADTFRGNIYDRNYNRLVYNKNINCATYYAVKNIKEEEINTIVNFLIKNVNVDIESVTQRDKKDFLILKDDDYVKSLLSADELKAENDTIYKLKLDRITDDILNDKLNNNDIKYYMLFSKISNCRSGSVVLLENLSIKEASLIGENSSLLRGIKVTNDWSREYTYENTFKSVLGRVTTKKQGLPASTKDILLAEDYNNDSRVGVSGLESQYESVLAGSAAKYSMTYDSAGNPIIKSVSSGSKGDNIRLTIDWELQEYLNDLIESFLKSRQGGQYNNHIFVTLMDPNNGEIVAMAGKQRDTKTGEISDYASGNYLSAYAIGSTFKGGTIYTGFKEGLITKNTYFNDTAEGIQIAGTPIKRSWNKSGLGRLNEVQALAKSSNVYMFYVAIRLGGGTYEKGKPLYINQEAFDTLRQDVGELGLGVKTGIDVPSESLGYRGSVTSRQGGNLLDFSIGQYDTYTPIQMAQYVSTIANGGKRVQPHLFLESFNENDEGQKISLLQHKVKVLDDVSSYTLAFERVQTGFREGCVTGLAKAMNGYYQAAGKTGTAQVMINGTEYQNKAFIGYAPYNAPQISIACISESQSSSSSSACNSISKQALTKYFDKYGVKNK